MGQDSQGAYLGPFEEKLQNIGNELKTYDEQNEPAPEIDQGDRRALLLSFLAPVPPAQVSSLPDPKTMHSLLFQAIST